MQEQSGTPYLRLVKEVYESSNIKEIAQLLSSGDWIAVHAIPKEEPVFVLGRIR